LFVITGNGCLIICNTKEIDYVNERRKKKEKSRKKS
jgi:hypothetical protein